MINDAARPAPKRRFQRPKAQAPRVEGATRSAPRMKSSSKTNGIASARANGHPTIAPVAYNRVTSKVRLPFSALGGASANVNARVLAYIANVDGRKAVL